MNDAMRLLQRWGGLWSGELELESGALLNARVSISAAMDGHGSMMHVEGSDPVTGRLVRGLRILFAQGPDGLVQTVAYSTQLGLFGLEQTPDDDDVIAMCGVTEAGVQLNVTYREEAPDTLLLMVFWRPHGTSLPKDAHPALLGRIQRRDPWRPPAPGNA